MSDSFFPSGFPSSESMKNMIQDIQICSWRIKDFNNSRIDRWLSNFTGLVYSVETERRIALWLLSNFTYYNDKEVDHLCGILYKKFLHSYVSCHGVSPSTIRDEIKRFCFIPLGKASESGGFISYQFRQQARIGIDRFFYPDYESFSADDIVVFIDDVTISSSQSHERINDFRAKHYVSEYYLLTLIASEEAVRTFRQDGVNVIACIELDNRSRCFSSESILFYKFKSLLEPVKTMVEYYGRKLYSGHPLGFNDGQYLFGFYYNIPNNSLPILWSNRNWVPIFERKEKYSSDKRIWKSFERFI